ncbi:MAG: AbrB family transcriptional regulator [Anaerolineaceae bacterium 4572_5.1]|nr:MAG: AbrB family transcriptional regulator [Anaerolinea sp. 4484_236]OQY34210.1 MAG: AbrB family transcriptional regulator [Anaerolineaceae bacterium 4572_5.1]RLD07408.1 MAG: AbrB/MazE/SpoVT family DNA-binding domain-containing protein [Chloroflexota bacterium]
MTTNLSAKVSSRYQISIPSAARQALNIQTGDRLLIDVQDGVIVLIPQPSNYTTHMTGLHKAIWEKIDTDDYLANERDAWQV